MIAYHGTRAPVFGALDHARSGLGTHFGTRRSAHQRVRALGRFQAGASRVERYRLSVRNPLRLRDIGAWDSLPDVAFSLRIEQPFGGAGPDILRADDLRAFRAFRTDAEAWDFLRRKIEERGYDSVVYQNAVEDAGSDSYIVWRDELIEKLPFARQAASAGR